MNNHQFKIQAVELLEFQLLQPKEEFNLDAIEFKIKIEHKIDAKQNLLAVSCSVTLVSNENQLANIMVNCLYFIDDLKAISTQKKYKEKMIFLSSAVNSISVSTTRGVLAATTRGTFLHTAILPIVDPSQFEATTNLE